MSESLINSLTVKRKEIEAHIGSLEQDLEQARRDLSAILAATKVFSAEGVKVTAYMNLTRLFPRNELPKLARAAFAESDGQITTVQIATHAIAAKGLDVKDRHLRKAVTYKVIQIIRNWEKRRIVERVGKVGAVVVWRLA